MAFPAETVPVRGGPAPRIGGTGRRGRVCIGRTGSCPAASPRTSRCRRGAAASARRPARHSATPTLATAIRRWPWAWTGAVERRRGCGPRLHALADTVPGSSTANSSPPSRATRSPGRTADRSRWPTSTSSPSPTECPSVSLTVLKSSRSISSAVSGPGRRQRPPLERLVEQRPVRQPGQRVVGRLLAEQPLVLPERHNQCGVVPERQQLPGGDDRGRGDSADHHRELGAADRSVTPTSSASMAPTARYGRTLYVRRGAPSPSGSCPPAGYWRTAASPVIRRLDRGDDVGHAGPARAVPAPGRVAEPTAPTTTTDASARSAAVSTASVPASMSLTTASTASRQTRQRPAGRARTEVDVRDGPAVPGRSARGTSRRRSARSRRRARAGASRRGCGCAPAAAAAPTAPGATPPPAATPRRSAGRPGCAAELGLGQRVRRRGDEDGRDREPAPEPAAGRAELRRREARYRYQAARPMASAPGSQPSTGSDSNPATRATHQATATANSGAYARSRPGTPTTRGAPACPSVSARPTDTPSPDTHTRRTCGLRTHPSTGMYVS